jgi:hypothetical protein
MRIYEWKQCLGMVHGNLSECTQCLRKLGARMNFSKQPDGMQTFSTRALQHFINDWKLVENSIKSL